MRRFFRLVTGNALSLIGASITTVSAVLILTLYGLDVAGTQGNPYLGILAFVILPGVFIFGLALIPVGEWLARRRRRRALEAGIALAELPVIDLNQERTRRLLLTFVVATVVNVVILATATYKGVEVMDSTPFCGATCHTVMTPEYTTYQRSPHARVKCVECHIGPGADWFVKSKLSGSWQLVAVTFNLFPRPIPTPVHNLRPARETCEQCHWPSKFVGDRLKVNTHFAEDEENTELKTVLLLRVGGMEGRVAKGIHGHVAPDIRIRYRSDAKRETIYEVELQRPDGTVKRFKGPEAEGAPAGGAAPEAGEGDPMEWRTMDCIDCHNRPTHIYRTAEDEVDAALQLGRLDRSLPYLRREALRAMRGDYPTHGAASREIPAQLRKFYRDSYPDVAAAKAEAIERAGAEAARLHNLNVFPQMKIGWGTYPNHLGHQSSPGCFRCHDDAHRAADGETISQDCSTCHTLLAMEEKAPPILSDLQP
jgi:hypothetical protein